ncbi:MAG: hypothetical protein H8E34_11795 [Bacteroidetes bacterium]|nr:hypothetical protein [Bacteroidota bacterium]MBL6943756.1 hypothetical protein [Bacteroidales bacterium]
MSDIHLHIISFDIPYPANYGGVIDVFYKAKALSESGVKVHMHCFQYGRDHYSIMKDTFHKVEYYKRDISKKHLFKSIPYIVSTRMSEQLVKNLTKDNHPILMEGLHTSALLDEPKLKTRKRMVRAHNIEHEYYYNLGRAEKDIFKKYYFYNEAAKLKRYEKILEKADRILAISENDKAYFSKEFSRVEHIPAFHPFKEVMSKKGRGEYVLYHGNLSVAENENAVNFLLDEVFNELDIPLKIAGLNPPKQLKNRIANEQNIELVANPDDNALQKLIENAHVNISITAQKTGLKLKLLNNLYNGRFSLVNNKMLSGSNLDDLCIVANNHVTIRRKIKILFRKEFTDHDIEERKRNLCNIYNNGNNVKKLVDLIK